MLSLFYKLASKNISDVELSFDDSVFWLRSTAIFSKRIFSEETCFTESSEMIDF